MNNIFRSLFVVAFLAVISVVLSTKALTLADVELPDILKVDQGNSTLEARSYEKYPELTMDTVMDGTFQQDFEQYVADLMPLRDDVLLANAAMQRSSIKLAAHIAGYDIYPTFYGAGRCYDAANDAMVHVPHKKTEDWAQSYNDVAEVVNGFAQKHEDLRMVFVMPSRQNSSVYCPAHELMSNVVDQEFLNAELYNRIKDPVISVNLEDIMSIDYVQDYYRTDHHWRAPFAYEVYSVLLEQLMPGEDPVAIEGVTTGDKEFYGSNSRVGLCLTQKPDVMDDILYQSSDLDIILDGVSVELTEIHSYDKKSIGSAEFTPFSSGYEEYYHENYGLMEITNNDVHNGKTLLILGDSYSNNCERLYAEHYEKVYAIDARLFDGSIEEFVNEHAIDDVLFMMYSGTLVNEEVLKALAS